MTPDPFAGLHDLRGVLDRGECTAVELAAVYLDRISRATTLHAFVHVDAEAVLRQAESSDLRRQAGHPLGPLDGLPIALKDLCEIAGQVTTNGSVSRQGVVSTGTATVVERLRSAGMVILGKTHMVEFAYGGWGTNPLMGAPRNPWDLTRHRTPGGSSSGSGVAVAAGLSPAAIGSDTGGSIRNPASLCGITGLKTTVGLVSLHGVLPLSPTCDSIGPMTRDVIDAAWLTQALAGRDARDSRTWDAPLADYTDALAAPPDLRGRRVSVMREQDFPIAVEPGVVEVFWEAQRVFRDLGATLVEEPFPVELPELIRRNGQLIGAEAWHTHRATIEDESLPIGPWVRRRIIGGAAITAAEYIDALDHHRRARIAWARFLDGTDAMLMPSLPIAACPIEDVDETVGTTSMFTRAANHVGACAITLPAGFAPTGMPLGVQLVAKAFDESALFRCGRAFQDATDWHRRRPDLRNLV